MNADWKGVMLTALGLTIVVVWLALTEAPAAEHVYIAPEIPKVECIDYDEAKARYGKLALNFMVLTGGCV